jgi:hypothetical protein
VSPRAYNKLGIAHSLGGVRTVKPTVFLFDYLVGAGEQRRQHAKAERLCGLEVDYQLELGWQHDRQVCRLGPGENAARVGSSLTIGREDARTVADEPACLHV